MKQSHYFFLKPIIFFIIFFASISNSVSQTKTSNPYLNLDFDREGTINPWTAQMLGYSYDLDTVRASHGKRCLSINCTRSVDQIDTSMPGAVSNFFPIEIQSGKKTKIQISVEIRVENISVGLANFEVAALSSSNSPLVATDLTKDSIHGTANWKRYSISFECDTNTKSLAIACQLNGSGKAWFDNITITVNGEKYPEGPLIIPELSKNDKDLLSKKIIAFDPKGNSDDNNLKKLDPFFDGHSVIGLGEATHGTHEFFQTKIKLIKYLITKKGFTHFALEANVAETELVNEYVHTGKGNLDTLIKGFHFWCWMTQEMKDLIIWIKNYNTSTGRNIQFIGIDMQFVDFPAEQIKKFIIKNKVANSQEISILCNQYITTFHKIENGEWKLTKVLAIYSDSVYLLLTSSFLNTVSAKKDSVDFKKIIIFADNLRQFSSLLTSSNGLATRDSSMALNLYNMLYVTSKPSKVIVWSHNMHQWKTNPFMGGFIKKEFGDQFVCIGTAFDKGQYNGIVQGDLKVNEALPSYPGSFEYLCKDLNSNNAFFLDLMNYSDTSNRPNIFFSAFDHRNIGLTARKFSFSPTVLPKYYDAIIYIPESSPSHLLDFAK